jgi:Ca2+-binding RTX toxin-like protein
VQVTKDDLRISLGSSGAAISFKLEDSAQNATNPVLKLTLSGTRAANVVGNAHNNLIIGNDGANVIDGLGGNDKLLGRGGEDELQGGAGNDWLDGGAGWDRLFGGSGNDRLFADEGGSTAAGASGSDLLSGGSGNDMLIVATKDASKVQLLGGSGNDLYRFANFDDGSDGGPKALHLNAVIADLTQGDGIDMGGFRMGSTGPTSMGSLKSSNPVSGDRAFDFGSGSLNAGLKAVGLGKGTGDAPVVSESMRGDVLGSLKVALAGELEVNEAIGRGSNATTGVFAEVSGFESVNTLLTAMNPVYSTLP